MKWERVQGNTLQICIVLCLKIRRPCLLGKKRKSHFSSIDRWNSRFSHAIHFRLRVYKREAYRKWLDLPIFLVAELYVYEYILRYKQVPSAGCVGSSLATRRYLPKTELSAVAAINRSSVARLDLGGGGSHLVDLFVAGVGSCVSNL